ncbi:2Fe-2S iron-sulfur cluster-binding protein (plasmid) [Mesorhizobium sp. AaZ16]|uniref:2Fe-2S iron-sulfur cluster-binding protein n=1 Tax=Mesorhizobium sp. AaZ16 TaxID=3402289 RepID=UPI00374ECA01
MRRAIAASTFPPHASRAFCGTCRTVKLSGEVAMDDLGGLSLEEKAAGYVLACCSRPQGTVCLDLSVANSDGKPGARTRCAADRDRGRGDALLA